MEVSTSYVICGRSAFIEAEETRLFGVNRRPVQKITARTSLHAQAVVGGHT